MYVSPVGLALQYLSFKVKIEDTARQRTKTDASPPFLFVFPCSSFFLTSPKSSTLLAGTHAPFYKRATAIGAQQAIGNCESPLLLFHLFDVRRVACPSSR